MLAINYLIKYFFLGLLLTILVANQAILAVPPATIQTEYAQNEIVTFADPNLEKAIQAMIKNLYGSDSKP